MNKPQQQTKQAQKIHVLKNSNGIEHASEEIERACIGAVLTNPTSYYKIARLVDDGNGFFFLSHRIMWSVIKHLVDNEMAVDTVTVSRQLEEIGRIEEIPPSTITQMIIETPTSAHVETYARLIQRLHSKRQMLSLAADIKSATDTDEPLERVLSKVQSKIDATLDSISKRVVMTMSDHSHDHFTESEEARAKGEILKPILSRIPGLDNRIEGFYPATYLIGGKQHQCKTITLSTIALNAALDDYSVLFINCADGDLSTVLATLYGMECDLPPAMIERKTWNNEQYQTYIDCLSRMSKLRLFVKHQNGITPRDIWTQANIIQRTHGLDMIVIDYIQEMGVDNDVKVHNLREKNIYVSRALKDIRKKFNVPVVYGAQIKLGDDNDKQPRIEDVQESKNIIQNADVGIALWHKIESIPEFIISVQKNKKGNHTKGTGRAGFSNVTGRVASKQQETHNDNN